MTTFTHAPCGKYEIFSIMKADVKAFVVLKMNVKLYNEKSPVSAGHHGK